MNRRSKIAGLIVGVAWAILSLVPFVFAGESSGMIWFPINLPISALFESVFLSNWVLVPVVTVVNALAYGWIAGWLVLLCSKRR
jgi:hypothetical protein